MFPVRAAIPALLARGRLARRPTIRYRQPDAGAGRRLEPVLSSGPHSRATLPAHPNALLPHARTRAARAAFGGERRRAARNAREHRRGGASLHTGAWTEGAKLSQAYAREYYQGDSIATGQLLPDTILPAGLSAQEQREACRALKGQLLRQEVYAEDGTAREPHPYMVSERSYAVRRDEKAKAGRHGVFFIHPREVIDYHYERNPEDPRITHAFTLEVDAYGIATRSAAVAYPRRDTLSPAAQSKVKITVAEVAVEHLDDEPGYYRVGVPIEERGYELTGLTPTGNDVFLFADIENAAEIATVLPYEAVPTSGYQKRLLAQTKNLYYDNDLTGPLGVGVVEFLALPYESYTKAFAPTQIDDVFDERVTNGMLTEGGYVQLLPDDAWWAPSGRQVFSADHFYLPIVFRDPFGNETSITYDDYDLLVIEATDALGNAVSATQDYRTLSPSLVTDPNGNRAAVKADALGVVIATAVMGKVGSSDGDTLEDPTTSFEYDLERFKTQGLPVGVHAAARELHGAGNSRFQHTYSYFDGAGRELMRKVQAEPGLAPERDEHGQLVYENRELVLVDTDPRWVGTGRTILNNKGLPIKQYEPFFSSTHKYEDEADLVESGVTPILHYDPLGRLIRTDLPDGSYSKVEFDPWTQTTWDPNDTVFDPADPNNTRSLWYESRYNLPSGPERRAATLTAAHAGTMTVAELDVLGRPFRTTDDDGTLNKPVTTQTLDIEGNPLVLTDARGIAAMTHVFAMGGRKLEQVSVDAGTRWTLTDVMGQPLRSWDSRDHALRSTYDALRRPLELFIGSIRRIRRDTL